MVPFSPGSSALRGTASPDGHGVSILLHLALLRIGMMIPRLGSARSAKTAEAQVGATHLNGVGLGEIGGGSLD